MVHYIDSNFLLTILLEETEKDYAAGVWTNAIVRLSSILLEAECTITIRRTFEKFKKELSSDWLREKEDELKNLIEEVEIRIIDKEIIETIKVKKDLFQCRTLDAIHIATALEVKSNTPQKTLYMCSYDKNVRRLSHKLGFRLFPEKIEENLKTV